MNAILLQNTLMKTGTGKRRHQLGALLTGLGNCIFFAAVIDLLCCRSGDRRGLLITAGLLITFGWIFERWGASQQPVGIRTIPTWKRFLTAGIPLVVYLITNFPDLIFRDQILHEKVAMAAYSGNLDTLKQVAPSDSYISGTLGEYHETPLGFAVQQGHRDVVVYLVSLGVDPNHPNDSGKTPLSLADSNKELRALLITAGAHE
jgi:hypothetical protein